MSFQDIGKRNAGRSDAQKTGFSSGKQFAGKGKESLAPGGSRIAFPGSVAQISESLSQFQVCLMIRHV